jgi:hypothetical protein
LSNESESKNYQKLALVTLWNFGYKNLHFIFSSSKFDEPFSNAIKSCILAQLLNQLNLSDRLKSQRAQRFQVKESDQARNLLLLGAHMTWGVFMQFNSISHCL